MAKNKVLKKHFNNSVFCRLQLPVKIALQYYKIKDKYKNENIYMKNKVFNVAAYMRYHKKRKGLEHTFSSVPSLNQRIIKKQNYPIIQENQYVWELVISLRRSLKRPLDYSKTFSHSVDQHLRNLFSEYGTFKIDLNHFSSIHANEKNLHCHVLVWQNADNIRIRKLNQRKDVESAKSIKDFEKHNSSRTLVDQHKIKFFKNAIYQSLNTPLTSINNIYDLFSGQIVNEEGVLTDRDMITELMKDVFFNQVTEGTAMNRARNIVQEMNLDLTPEQLLYLADIIITEMKNINEIQKPTLYSYNKLDKDVFEKFMYDIKDPSNQLAETIVPEGFLNSLDRETFYIEEPEIDEIENIEEVKEFEKNLEEPTVIDELSESDKFIQQYRALEKRKLEERESLLESQQQASLLKQQEQERKELALKQAKEDKLIIQEQQRILEEKHRQEQEKLAREDKIRFDNEQKKLEKEAEIKRKLEEKKLARQKEQEEKEQLLQEELDKQMEDNYFNEPLVEIKEEPVIKELKTEETSTVSAPKKEDQPKTKTRVVLK